MSLCDSVVPEGRSAEPEFRDVGSAPQDLISEPNVAEKSAELHGPIMPLREASLGPKLGQFKALLIYLYGVPLCPVRAWQQYHGVFAPLVLLH
mgnify:CR=1 FL=1